MKTVTIISNAKDEWSYEGYYVDGKLVVEGNPDEPDMMITLLEALGHKVVIHDLSNTELDKILINDEGFPENLNQIKDKLNNV